MDKRPDRYLENGRVVWRASAIGACVRALVAEQIGMTPEPVPQWMLEKWAEGVAGEPVVLGMLKDRWRIVGEGEGWHLVWDDGQVLVEMPVGEKVIVRGHCDGVGTKYINGDGRRRVLEVKCVSRGFAEDIRRTLPPRYMWQCSVYGRGLGMDVVLVLGVKDDDGRVVSVEEIDAEIVGAAAVKLRVIGLEQCIEEGVLPPCSYRQYPCPFPELCEDIGVPEPTEEWDLEERLRESLDVRH